MLSPKQDVTHLVDLVTIECANLPPLHISHQLLLGVPETIIIYMTIKMCNIYTCIYRCPSYAISKSCKEFFSIIDKVSRYIFVYCLYVFLEPNSTLDFSIFQEHDEFIIKKPFE